MNIQAIIFDFDGVIVDSEPLHWKSFQAVLEPLGIFFTWEEYLRDYVGFDDRDALRFAFSSNGMSLENGQMESLISRKADEFGRLAASPDVDLYPGVKELLEAYRGRLPIAICSGALRQDIEPVVDRFGIRDAFELMVTADDVERSKPDPESYRLTVKRLEEKHGPLSGDQCVVIEDTPAGVASANGAGLFSVGVTHTHTAESLAEAHHVVESLDAVKKLLESP